jgi:hypothetical protein
MPSNFAMRRDLHHQLHEEADGRRFVKRMHIHDAFPSLERLAGKAGTIGQGYLTEMYGRDGAYRRRPS